MENEREQLIEAGYARDYVNLMSDEEVSEELAEIPYNL